MALCGRARGLSGSRKDAKTQRKPRTRLCHAWSGAPTYLTSPSTPLVVPHIAFCLLAFAGDNFRGRTGLYRATANDLPLLLLNQESFNSWMVS